MYPQTAEERGDAHEIEPGMWLGNQAAACSQSFLERNNITRLVCCAREFEWPCFVGGPGFVKARVSVSDCVSEGPALEASLPEATTFLIMPRKGASLVFCWAGQSRSATVMCAMLMRKHCLPYEQALARIKAKRNVGPNAGFIDALKRFQQRLLQAS
jgi:hypothetical protein